MRVAALFVCKDSIYRELGADCYDAQRDARTFDLSCPVVAHPPCRAWGSLRTKAKPRRDERDLAWFALWAVRHCGGVLEHPALSSFWRAAGLPDGKRDAFGGLVYPMDQHWLGHRAKKATRLYIVGPVIPPPITLSVPSHTVGLWSGRDRATARPSIAKREFEATPRPMAEWLLATARGAAA